jgi:hypothetical protein
MPLQPLSDKFYIFENGNKFFLNILLIGEMINDWRNNVTFDAKQQWVILEEISGFYYPDEQSGQKLLNFVQRFQPAEVLGMLEWASEGQKWEQDKNGLRIMALDIMVDG